MKASVPFGTVFALVFVATIACSNSEHQEDEDKNNFREDVITCEDAVARLERCCPGFDATPVLCNYYYYHSRDVGCGSTTTVDKRTAPALSIKEAMCIQAMTCDQLVPSGVCDRAAAAREHASSSSTDEPNDGISPPTRTTSSLLSNSSQDLVCP